MEVVVAQGKLSHSRLRSFLKKRSLYLAVLLLVIAVAITVIVIDMHHRTVNVNDQRKLENSLKMAESAATNASNATIISDTTELINGQKQSIYNISKSDLATLYLQRATAFSNLNENTQAISDYQTARQLNSGLQRISLEGEVDARYKLGQRKELLPLLQQVVRLEEQTTTGQPGSSSTAGIYQNAIQAIQNNQEVSL